MKKDMPLNGLRWSRDNGSALYDTPQTAVFGRAGGKIQWISSLRGLLVFLVFVSHLAIPIISKDTLFVLGRIGVVGFFLISGYLAWTSVSRRTIKQFYFNRFIRIYPMYWILLLMLFLLSDKYPLPEFLWNLTLFEEFVGCERIIGSSWMLPIMVIFFALLPFIKNNSKKTEISWWLICAGCLIISILRFVSGKPFPTALCLLMCVGLLGFLDWQVDNKKLTSKILTFELLLVVCSYLSYGERVIYYFVAYNLGFAVYYIFKRRNFSIKVFDILGEQGFTFFLGASIPITVCFKLIPSIVNWEWYYCAFLQFVLTFLFSYILTQYCEKPMLRCCKDFEKKIK